MSAEEEIRGDVRHSVDGGTYAHGDSAGPGPSTTQDTRSLVGSGRGERAMVPREEPSSYYGRPIVKPPIWKPEIPFYFFFGGMAGASAVLAAVATFTGRRRLARTAWLTSLAGVTISPILLTADLGKPMRFINMLRVFKVTSPMNLGAWLLVAENGAVALATALNLLDRKRRGGLPEIVAGALGAPLTTYTAVLISNSTIPAWSEARLELPFVFASGAATSAAGALAIAVPAEEAGPARRLAVIGTVAEEIALAVMHRRLGPLDSSYTEGTAGRLGKISRGLMLGGGGLLAVAGRRRSLAVAGGSLLLAGAACRRWSTFKAGFHSAEDPGQTVRTQRKALTAGDRRGA
jgi:formate-dependent nitrite reductase membrane component NrfD